MKKLCALLVLATGLLWVLHQSTNTQAATLTNRSDRISTSAKSEPASHRIIFTNPTEIPAGGKIIITPQSSAFTIPSLNHEDLDLEVNATDASLSASAGTGSGSSIGAQAISGSSGSIQFTLNDTDPISAGSAIVIEIGSSATFQSAGDQDITNPSSIGTYALTIATTTNLNAPIDSGDISVAITDPVGISSLVGTLGTVASPVMNPTTGLFENTVTVSITSATSGATIYYTTDGSNPTISSSVYTTPLTFTETTTLKALAAKTDYTASGVVEEIYTISHTQSNTGVVLLPSANATVTDATLSSVYGTACQNGAYIQLHIPAGSIPDQSQLSLTCLSWSGFPNKTGAPNKLAIADVLFGIFIQDATGRVVRYPKQALTATLVYTPQQVSVFTPEWENAFFAPENRWNITPIKPQLNKSNQFQIPLTTIGNLAILGNKKTTLQCASIPADLNCDTKVNLTDLSILMYYWQKSGTTLADINKDKIVNLVDFSILLYWWND